MFIDLFTYDELPAEAFEPRFTPLEFAKNRHIALVPVELKHLKDAIPQMRSNDPHFIKLCDRMKRAKKEIVVDFAERMVLHSVLCWLQENKNLPLQSIIHKLEIA